MSETYLSNLDQSEVLATTRQEFEASRLNIYFVDSSVPGAEALALGLGEGSSVYMLDGSGDGLEQIASVLEGLGSPVDALHIYSHGQEGAIQLGGQWYDAAALDAAAATLARIGQSLNTGGDILLYGCNTASGSLGESFLERMARLASANVAASDDITGTGGDWQLEASSGVVDSAAQQPGDWQGSLGSNQISGWGVLEGTSNNDSITGFVSGDRMYGHGGQDTLVGGQGNDVYIIDGTGAEHTLIVEKEHEGVDTVYSQIKAFNLSAGQDTASGSDTFDASNTSVEYIVLEAQQGFVAQNATGNSQSQTIVGNALANNLAGNGGNDLLYGHDGNDYLDSGDGNPSNGKAGTDPELSTTMYGGKGDDNYIVRNQNDVITEYANEGTDHVFSFHDYTLGSNLENLTLLGSEAKRAIGNALNNELHGNSVANILEGGTGNDTLYGSSQSDGTTDTLDGGAGNDAYHIYNDKDIILDSAGIDSVYASTNYSLDGKPMLEHLFLQGGATKGTGNDLNNRIVGNESLGSVLDGGKGNDTLEGGRGNDTFHIDSAGDMVIDHGGNNEVQTSVTVDLNRFANASIQKVVLEGDANINATAKRTVGASLMGNAGSNILTGGNEADMLDSGDDGVDRLVGGAGNDYYVLRHANATVVENAGEANNGRDTVQAHMDYTLAANVEELILAGNATSGTGNSLANRIDGSSVAGGAVLHGGVNAVGLQGDTLIGSAGNDQIYSYNANDSIQFNDGNDVLYISYTVAEADALADPHNDFDWAAYFSARGVNLPEGVTVMYRGNPVTIKGPGIVLEGTEKATHLVGTDRSDTITAHESTDSTLDGGKGGDLMVGGSGNDVFYVDSVGANGDTVLGGSSGGLNTIRSTASIDLNATKDGIQYFQNVDAVELQGTAALTLKGYADADSGMTLTGNSGNNQIWGGKNADTIDGGAGADVMTGGDGDDIYVVDNTGDRISETTTGGQDSIYTRGISINLGLANYKNAEFVQNVSSVSFTPSSTETVAGTKSISMTGTTNAETLIAGNAGDTLDGGGGADNLVGGTGADKFFYYGQGESISGNSGKDADGNEFRDTLTVRKNFTGSITLGEGGITGIEAVVLEAGTANQQAANVDASGADSSLGVLVQGNSGNSNITGSAGDDSLYGGGGYDNISAGSGNDFVEITANAAGYGQLDGGSGQDTLSFGAMADKVTFAADGSIVQRVGAKDVTVNATNFNVFSGGAGNDTLDASGSASGMALAGGLGADQLLGGAGNDTLIADGGNDVIRTGKGSDIVRLTTAAIGSTITVSDFDAGVDSVDDSALRDNWGKPTITQNGANATLTWTNPNNTREKVTLILQNTVGADVLLGCSKVVDSTFDASDTAEGGNPNIPWDITTAADSISVTGGNRNDAIVSTGTKNTLSGLGGDDVLEGSDNTTFEGGTGNDTIYVTSASGTASLSVNGGAGDDEIGIDTIGSGSFTLDGGAGDDILYFDSTPAHVTLNSDGQVSQIEMNGAIAQGTAQNIEMLWGSSGDDSVDANMSSVDYSNTEGRKYIGDVVYGTGGGNDTYIGGQSRDEVHLHHLDASSRVSLDGRGGQDYLSFAQDQAIDMTLGDDGSISNLVADGQTVANSAITGFDNFWLGDKADTITASKEAISGITSTVGFAIRAGGGNDSIALGEIDITYDARIDAGSGNDVVSAGAMNFGNSGKLSLNGDAGSDTLRLNAADGQGLSLTFDSMGGVSSGGLGYYTPESDDPAAPTDIVQASISGFEHFDGSANAANYFDTRAYTMQGGSLAFTGGEGYDHFYLGSIQAGSVTLSGGMDSTAQNPDGDYFQIGDVGMSASVKIEAYTGNNNDVLQFAGSKAVSLQLTAKGDIGSVSMGGQKVNITGTGLNSYTGTAGNDLIDASRVTSVDNQDNIMELDGGDGDDTIKTGNINNGFFYIKAGKGNDSIVGGAGVDYISLGDYVDPESSTIPASNDGGDTISTGGGKDVITVYEQKDGSITTITDFTVGVDTLNDNDLLKAGWSREVHTTPGLAGVTVTYSIPLEGDPNQRKSFHLQFTNQKSTTFLPTIVSLGGKTSDTVTGPAEVFGIQGVDNCIVYGSGAITLDGNGGSDSIEVFGKNDSNDTLVVASATDTNYTPSFKADGMSGNDYISLKGTASIGSYVFTGDEGNDQIYLEHLAGSVQVTAKGGADNDSITLAAATGGSAILEGGDGTDIFYLGPIFSQDATTPAVTVRGGTAEGDTDSRDAVHLMGNGATVGNTLYLDGIESVQGTAGADSIDGITFSASLDRVTISGGKGNDTIAGSSALINGDEGDDLLVVSQSVNTTVKGGSGIDTLSLEKLGGAASLVDNATSSSGTGQTTGLKYGEDSVISIEEIESISLGTGQAFNLSLAGKVTFSNTTALEFGSGQDRLTLTDAGAGSTIRIRNFDWRDGGDSIVSSSEETDAWTLTNSVVSGGNTTQTYTKNINGRSENTTVILEGVEIDNKSNSITAQKKTLDGGESFTGSRSGDTITVNLGGNAPLYVNTFGSYTKSPRDSVTINVKDNVDAGWVTIEAPSYTDDAGQLGDSSHSRLYMGGDGVTMHFGAVTTVSAGYYDDMGIYQSYEQTLPVLTQVSDDGKTANLEAWGFGKYHGTSGADSVTIDESLSDAYYIEYESMGGDDTYIGGAGRDEVYATLDKADKMSLVGGGDNNQVADILHLEANKGTSSIHVTLDANGDITGDGVRVGNHTHDTASSFRGFEQYRFSKSAGDSLDASAFTAVTVDAGCRSVYMGDGNDTIVINPEGGSINAVNMGFEAYGEDGKDTFSVGTVTGTGSGVPDGSGSFRGVWLAGGADADTYQLSADGYGLTISENEYGDDTGDKIEFYGVAEGFDVGSVQFTLVPDDPYSGGAYTLQVSGIQGSSGNTDSTLTFQSYDMTDDSLLLYSGSVGSAKHMASINLESVLKVLQDSPDTTTMTFSEIQETGKYKV